LAQVLTRLATCDAAMGVFQGGAARPQLVAFEAIDPLKDGAAGPWALPVATASTPPAEKRGIRRKITPPQQLMSWLSKALAAKESDVECEGITPQAVQLVTEVAEPLDLSRDLRRISAKCTPRTPVLTRPLSSRARYHCNTANNPGQPIAHCAGIASS